MITACARQYHLRLIWWLIISKVACIIPARISISQDIFQRLASYTWMSHTLMVAYSQMLYVSDIRSNLPSRRSDTSVLTLSYTSSTSEEKIFSPREINWPIDELHSRSAAWSFLNTSTFSFPLYTLEMQYKSMPYYVRTAM